MIGAGAEEQSDLTGATGAGRWHSGFEEGLGEYFLDPSIRKKSRNPAPKNAPRDARKGVDDMKRMVKRDRGGEQTVQGVQGDGRSIVDIVKQHRAAKAADPNYSVATGAAHAHIEDGQARYAPSEYTGPTQLQPRVPKVQHRTEMTMDAQSMPTANYQPQYEFANQMQQPIMPQQIQNYESDESLLMQLVSAVSGYLPPDAYHNNFIIQKVLKRLNMM